MQFLAFERFIGLVGDQYGVPGVPRNEEQRGEYESGVVDLGSELWRIRTARVTPKKAGAFVAVWERDAETRSTRPYNSADATAGLLVFVSDQNRFGVFRFAASHLITLGITSSAAHEGKRGFRLYPGWCTGLNRQATITQQAQSAAFMVLS